MPVLHLRESPAPLADSLILMKFWLIVTGVYLWEYVTTLHYEWDVIRGRQRYRWTIWVYSLARLATLIVVVANLVSFSVTSLFNCQAMTTSTFTFALLALGSGSLLIVLRIFALWNRNKIIVRIATAVWGVNLVSLIAGVVQIRAAWSPVLNACKPTNLETSKLSICSLLATDIFLLLVMFVGLLRLRRSDGGSLGLGRLLWKQGVIWLAIATAAELPQAVMVVLDLNDALDIMFLVPSLVAMTIAATRIYRSLSYFVSSPKAANDSDTPRQRSTSSHLVSTKKDAPVVHISSNRLEVSVHTAYEEHPMSQLADKPHEVGFEDYTEDREGGKMNTLDSVGAAV